MRIRGNDGSLGARLTDPRPTGYWLSMVHDGRAAASGRPADAQALRATMAVLGMHEYELWVAYLVMMGRYSYGEFSDAVHGRRQFSATEYGRVVAAIRDELIDRGLDSPTFYLDSPS